MTCAGTSHRIRIPGPREMSLKDESMSTISGPTSVFPSMLAPSMYAEISHFHSREALTSAADCACAGLQISVCQQQGKNHESS